MTEDEARKKACPMSFNASSGKECAFCIASDCACWVCEVLPTHEIDCLTVKTQFDEQPQECTCGVEGSGHCGLIR